MPEGYENPSLSKEDALWKKFAMNMGFHLRCSGVRDLEEEYGSLRRRHGLPDLMRETVKQQV